MSVCGVDIRTAWILGELREGAATQTLMELVVETEDSFAKMLPKPSARSLRQRPSQSWIKRKSEARFGYAMWRTRRLNRFACLMSFVPNEEIKETIRKSEWKCRTEQKRERCAS